MRINTTSCMTTNLWSEDDIFDDGRLKIYKLNIVTKCIQIDI